MATETTQCHHRLPTKQETIDDNFINESSVAEHATRSFLTESFILNSRDRVVIRKGSGSCPNPSFSKKHSRRSLHRLSLLTKVAGNKVGTVDLNTLESYMKRYVDVVNLILERVYTSPQRAEQIGHELSLYRGEAYNLLRKETDLCYQGNKEFQNLIFERLHRDALEEAGRIILSQYIRRQLTTSAIRLLCDSQEDAIQLLSEKWIVARLIRKVRDSCELVRKNGAGYHYALSVLRQLRSALDQVVISELEQPMGTRVGQRLRVRRGLSKPSPKKDAIRALIINKVDSWSKNGYKSTTPRFKSPSLDYSASTENSTGQGYWFESDTEKNNEVLLHIKLPRGMAGTRIDDSTRDCRTLTFRFLNWLPQASRGDTVKADQARASNLPYRAERLEFRACVFRDMHEQLMNTIQFQHKAHELHIRRKGDSESEKLVELKKEVSQLKKLRRSAPPKLLIRGHRVTLQIPFHAPDTKALPRLENKTYDSLAGADRGLRVSVALSVLQDQTYSDQLVRMEPLLSKRQRLRRQASFLQGEVKHKMNNWETKRPGQSHPSSLLKKERNLDALWHKVRRLDREVSRVVASHTVWFCEEHNVKTLYLEDLRS